MEDEKSKTITAMDILAAIERDVNEGTFDKALYQRDIALLKGQLEELSLLRSTLGQLKDQLPQYAEHVEVMQSQIERMEDDVEVMVDTEVDNAIRFNDSFNSLLDMIKERDPSKASGPSLKKKKRKDQEKDAQTSSAPVSDEKQEDSNKPILKKGVLLSQLLALVEQQWVTESDFERLPGMMGVEELSAKIFVLTEVVALLRLIPEEMFANDETKQNIIVAAQECLDGFIEEEAEEEIEGLADVEQGFGIVGEVTADLGFVTSNTGSDGLINSTLLNNTVGPAPEANN